MHKPIEFIVALCIREADVRRVLPRSLFTDRPVFARGLVQGNALKLVIGSERTDSSASREAVAKAIARARSWYDLIVQGKAVGLPDLGRQHGLTHRYVKNIFPLAFLRPESVEILLSNQDGRSRTLDSLMGKVPIKWNEQAAFIADA